jgi:hypothetical protein
MRSSKLLLVLVVLGVCTLLASTTASASVINVSTGTTLFFDDFEAQAENQTSHILWPDYRGDLPAARPTGGSPGAWSSSDENWANVQVTDCNLSGYTQAYDGTKHLRICKYDGTPGWASETFARQAINGQHIRFEQWVNITDSGVGGAQILGRDSNDDVRINVYAAGGGVVQSYSGGFNTISGLTYSVNQWQKWTIDYNINDPTFTLKIGDSPAVSGIAANSGGALGYVSLTQDVYRAAVFFDDVRAVPEPSTVVILLSAVVGLLVYAWRKRR